MVNDVVGSIAAWTQGELAGAGGSTGRELLNALLRWLHILAGIVWIGHLYFFNFVNANFAPTMDGETKRKVVPQLMPRALFWFRMGAATTWVTGVLLFFLVYWGQGVMYREGVAGTGLANRTIWILLGMLLGTVMAFNVWFIIWPKQRRIITAVRDGQAPDPGWARTAGLASRINTYLSVPLLLTMVSNSVPVLFDVWGSLNHLFLLVTVAAGFAVAYGWFKLAPGVKGF